MSEENQDYNFQESVDGEKDKVREVRDSLAEEVRTGWKPLLIGAGAITVLTLIFTFSNISFPSISPDQESKVQPDIEGEWVNITLTDRHARPMRPTIEREDGIRFINEASHAYNLTFDREVENFVLEPGEQKPVEVSSIIYYEAVPLEKDSRKIKAGVNIE